MNEIVTPHRIASQPQSLYYSCEKAGLVLQNQPIPWGAESVLVEALLRLDPTARRKTDFTLRLPGLAAIPAETLRKDETTENSGSFSGSIRPRPRRRGSSSGGIIRWERSICRC